MFLSTFRAVTVAFGMTAPFSSVTVPEIVPVVWPNATTEEISKRARRNGKSLVAFMDRLPSRSM
jgi:hypothetical protein